MSDKEQHIESAASGSSPIAAQDALTEPYQESLAESILEAEALLAELSPANVQTLREKIEALESNLLHLKQIEPLPPRAIDLEVAVLTVKGHFERATGHPDASEATYREALEILRRTEGDSAEPRIANLWTCCGLSALSGDSAGSWKRALNHLDKAISIREKLEAPSLSDEWGLSASWLNRGDALTRLGGEENLSLALEAARKAAAILEHFDLNENPVFRTRMALSWINQGAAYLELTSEHRKNFRDEAFEAYQSAIKILKPGADSGIPESKRVLAVTLTNLSRARLQLGGTQPEASAKEAREALELIEGEEINDPEVAGLGITARIVLCRSLELLQQDRPGDLEITDIAEEGLTIALELRKNAGNTPINEVALGELMRCGAEAYLKHSPHFLTDYLMEFLTPEKNDNRLADVGACHEVAVQVLWQGIAGLQEKGFQDIGSDAYEKREALLVSWHQCREHLAEIRNRFFILE